MAEPRDQHIHALVSRDRLMGNLKARDPPERFLRLSAWVITKEYIFNLISFFGPGLLRILRSGPIFKQASKKFG